MFAFINFLFLLLAEAAAPESGKADWHTYFNYPGFEAWKFFNLAVFVAIIIYLLRTPLSNAFKAKRDAIRAELIKAEEERQAAQAKLTESEAKLANLDEDAKNVRERSAHEATAEKNRIVEQTDADVQKIRAQATAEIARNAQAARANLRKFSAEESIRLAEERIKSAMNTEADSRLVKAGIQSIGGLN